MPARRITRITSKPSTNIPPGVQVSATWVNDTTHEVGTDFAHVPFTDITTPDAFKDALTLVDGDLNFDL